MVLTTTVWVELHVVQYPGKDSIIVSGSRRTLLIVQPVKHRVPGGQRKERSKRLYKRQRQRETYIET